MVVPADTFFHVLDRHLSIHVSIKWECYQSLTYAKLYNPISLLCASLRSYRKGGQNAKCSANAHGIKLHMQRCTLCTEEWMVEGLQDKF